MTLALALLFSCTDFNASIWSVRAFFNAVCNSPVVIGDDASGGTIIGTAGGVNGTHAPGGTIIGTAGGGAPGGTITGTAGGVNGTRAPGGRMR